MENKFDIDNFLGEEFLFAKVQYDQHAVPVLYEKSTIDTIQLYFKVGVIQISSINDTDEIKLTFIQDKTNQKKRNIEADRNIFKKYIGKKLNQVWTSINSSGYFDLCILSFSYLDPNILIVSETSGLKLFEAKYMS
jgi:hypothetical protein